MVCENCGKVFLKDWRKYPRGEVRFCSRSCSNSRSHSKETIEKISKGVNRNNKEKGVFREKRFCILCKNEIYFSNKHGYCNSCLKTQEFYKKTLSKSLIGKTGGARKGSGKSNSGTYKGHYCGSTWELAYIIYLLDNNIEFERNKETFDYIKKNGEKSTYLPDLIVEGKYVEIKGPQDKEWKSKLKCFPYDIEIIDKNKIGFYIDYVKQKYNVNELTLLYDEIEKKFCKECERLLSLRNVSGYCRFHVHLLRN